MALYSARSLQPLRPRRDRAALEELPMELLEYFAYFLDGFDLLQLSHTSPRLRKAINSQPQLWTQRLLESHDASDVHSALVSPTQRYLEETSLCFRGQDLDAAKRGDRCACAPIEQPRGSVSPLPLAPHRASSFSFDVWFSLLSSDADPSVLPGGIILGAQSVQWIHTMVWAHYHQQFLHVDTDRNLYCSVLNDPKQIVAEKLECDRWYHVALCYDDEVQSVYLDGQLVHLWEGNLHREWARLEHLQIGTGCISGDSPGKPTPKFCGWYGFHGLVDECRVWRHALSAAEVARLAKGLATLTSKPCYSLKNDDEGNYCGSMVEVKCARPRERFATSVKRLEGSAVANAVPTFWNMEWPWFAEALGSSPLAASSASPRERKPKPSRRRL